MSSAPTDAQLVAAARAGSGTAWDNLLARYQPALLRYLRLQTDDAELAADLAQENFLAALAHLDRLPANRPVGASLYRIAQLRLRRAWHQQQHRPASLDALLPQGGPELAARFQPDELAEDLAARALIRRVLAELSPSLREALLLSSAEGFSAPEVAAILGISRAAAERRISRAKARFRARYTELTAETD